MARDRMRRRNAPDLRADDALIEDVYNTVVPRVQDELRTGPDSTDSQDDSPDNLNDSDPLFDANPEPDVSNYGRASLAAPRERSAAVFGTTPDRFASGGSFTDRGGFRGVGRAPRIDSTSPSVQAPSVPQPSSAAQTQPAGDVDLNHPLLHDAATAQPAEDAPNETDRLELGPDDPLSQGGLEFAVLSDDGAVASDH